MTLKQLERLDNINYFAKFYHPLIRHIDCGRFAVLDDSEREDLLVFLEKKIKQIRKEKSKILRN